MAFLQKQVCFREETHEQERTVAKASDNFKQPRKNFSFYSSADRICLFYKQKKHTLEDGRRSVLMTEKNTVLTDLSFRPLVNAPVTTY